MKACRVKSIRFASLRSPGASPLESGRSPVGLRGPDELGTSLSGGLEDDVGNPFGYLVRQEEHGTRDGYEVRVRAAFKRAALVGAEPAVTLVGVDDPRWDARPTQPL